MVTLYDTTLRDGTQREGLSLSVEDKLRIAAKLDLLGVHYVEGGFPGSNPKDIEFFERVGELRLEQAVITAFGPTCRKNTPAEDDAGLDSLIATGCRALCIFGKAWDVHVTETQQPTLEENVRTTTPAARSPTRSWRSMPVPCRCRARSTATGREAATPTSPPSFRRSSSRCTSRPSPRISSGCLPR